MRGERRGIPTAPRPHGALSASFREGALPAVNLGDDADTTGAAYGQIAGALYGESGIPREWRDQLALHHLIEEFADRPRLLAP